MNAVTLIRTTAFDPGFGTLITELDKDLRTRYQPYQAMYDGFNKVDESARVVMAFQDDQPVGCGCFRPMTDAGYVEIKRMFVDPAFRGRGFAKQVLQELERWAAEEGYHSTRLETGDRQPEAVALYEKVGYCRIENYGPYVGLAASVCMEKKLA
ncbi:ribosomal protein S18 acetylase RimI-like enzyme [Larkinella arboricola]|uniref:Ribosomal protein S18 acetylase RimI-like enzyme n=1 Tax=Larkinella arboricola TaxID=643671 RepID=A0A327X1C2_LARAB|nr:GNAT family N-acetyltransferase [Larkinella arboricola]RAK00186.1 ribosomal protein S18 acetylase RimI-like enzyme [Larkinella arboricola]